MVNTVCLVVTGLTLVLKRTPLSAGIAIDGLNTSARFLPLIPIYKRICCMDTFLYIHSSFSRIRHFHFLKIQSSCECYVTSAMCGATHNACYRLGQKGAEHKEIRLHIWRLYACDVFPVTAEGPASRGLDDKTFSVADCVTRGGILQLQVALHTRWAQLEEHVAYAYSKSGMRLIIYAACLDWIRYFRPDWSLLSLAYSLLIVSCLEAGVWLSCTGRFISLMIVTNIILCSLWQLLDTFHLYLRRGSWEVCKLVISHFIGLIL